MLTQPIKDEEIKDTQESILDLGPCLAPSSQDEKNAEELKILFAKFVDPKIRNDQKSCATIWQQIDEKISAANDHGRCLKVPDKDGNFPAHYLPLELNTLNPNQFGDWPDLWFSQEISTTRNLQNGEKISRAIAKEIMSYENLQNIIKLTIQNFRLVYLKDLNLNEKSILNIMNKNGLDVVLACSVVSNKNSYCIYSIKNFESLEHTPVEIPDEIAKKLESGEEKTDAAFPYSYLDAKSSQFFANKYDCYRFLLSITNAVFLLKKADSTFIQYHRGAISETTNIDLKNKLHISLELTNDNIQLAWKIIKNYLLDYNISDFKSLSFISPPENKIYGEKAVVIYAGQQIDEPWTRENGLWQTFINALTTVFNKNAGILKHATPAPAAKIINDFFTMRHDANVNGDYVEELDAEKEGRTLIEQLKKNGIEFPNIVKEEMYKRQFSSDLIFTEKMNNYFNAALPASPPLLIKDLDNIITVVKEALQKKLGTKYFNPFANLMVDQVATEKWLKEYYLEKPSTNNNSDPNYSSPSLKTNI